MLHAKYRSLLPNTFLCIICVLSQIVNWDPAPEQQQVCPCPWSAHRPSVSRRLECLRPRVSGPDIIDSGVHCEAWQLNVTLSQSHLNTSDHCQHTSTRQLKQDIMKEYHFSLDITDIKYKVVQIGPLWYEDLFYVYFGSWKEKNKREVHIIVTLQIRPPTAMHFDLDENKLSRSHHVQLRSRIASHNCYIRPDEN